MKTIKFEELIQKIEELQKTRDHLVVAISGFGGAGKTTLAEKIKSHFPSSTWIQLDNFLINRGRGDGWAGGYDWDRLEQVLKDVRSGKNLHYQAYDWQKDALTDWYIDEKLPKLIVVEGVRILQPRFKPYFDLSVWLDVNSETATARGQARDKANWQDKDDKKGITLHLNTWYTTWAPKDREFFEKFRPDKTADFVVR